MDPNAALEMQLEAYRRMTGEERLAIALPPCMKCHARLPAKAFGSSIQRRVQRKWSGFCISG